MPSALRRFTKNIVIITNVVIAVLFILAVITPYVHPGKYWVLGALTLGFPVLFLLLSFFVFFWLVVKPRRSTISIIALLVGWKTTTETFGVAFRSNKKEDPETVKVLSWNVHMFNYYDYKKEPEIREKMFQLIRETNPAIACFQEFAYTMPYKDPVYTIDVFTKALQMPYHFIQSHPLDSTRLKKVALHYGKAIFSKYPIINQHHVFNHKGNYNYSFLYADIALPTGTVRVFNIHLQSLYFNNKDYEFVESPGESDETIEDG